MDKKKEDIIKWVIVITLVIIASYLLINYSAFDMSKELRKGQKEVGYQESLNSLSNSPSICIVEKLDNTKERIRQNIMNCGVNLASTLPLYGKKTKFYAIESNKCYDEKGVKEVKDCYEDIKNRGCFVIEIKGDKDVETYENLLSIPVGMEFDIEKDCKILEG